MSDGGNYVSNTLYRATPGRPFAKGNPGRTTLLAEKLMQDDAKAIVDAVLKAAANGDMTAARIVLDRIAPARRDGFVAFELPALATADDAAKAMASILAAVAAGELTPAEGTAIGGLVVGYARTLGTAERAAPSVDINFAPRQTLGGDEPLPDEPVL